MLLHFVYNKSASEWRDSVKSRIAILLTMTLLPLTAQPATLQAFPSGTGLFPTIQNAIDAAAGGDTIQLAPGTFTGEGNRRLDFGGKDLTLRGSGDPAVTVIDCQLQDVGMHFHSGETENSLVENLTITRGKDPERFPGAGIICEYSSPVFRHLILLENRAVGNAGISLYYASVLVEDCLFEGNTANGSGGAIGLGFSSVVIRRTSFINNTSDIFGGAINCDAESQLLCEDCLFEGNLIDDWGGAIRVYGSATAELTGCVFRNNQAKYGGALYASGLVTIEDCVFESNYAELFGGACQFQYEPDEGISSIHNSLFYANSADYGGGAILAYYYGAFTMSISTVVGNENMEQNGAGILCGTAGSAWIDNSIIAFNHGPGVRHDASSSIEIACSDVYGNTGGNYSGVMKDQTGINGNISSNPYFCDYENWTLTLSSQSACLPENNDCGVQMGALGEACTLTSVEEAPALGSRLLAAYPNPFNPTTTISMVLESATEVRLAVHDVAGRQIKVLHEGRLAAGSHELLWRGRDDADRPVPSGLYFIHMDSADGRRSRKITLLR
jgi:predicted outer membrane repeat protein